MHRVATFPWRAYRLLIYGPRKRIALVHHRLRSRREKNEKNMEGMTINGLLHFCCSSPNYPGRRAPEIQVAMRHRSTPDNDERLQRIYDLIWQASERTSENEDATQECPATVPVAA